VPVATIKYYLREGLLPPGELTAPNQASYSALHVRRLRLVRVLREVGELRIDAIRKVVAAIDEPGRSPHEVVGVAHHALSPAPAWSAAAELDEIDALLDHLGWEVSPGAPARDHLATALSSLRTLGRDVGADVFRPYAEAADRLAREEIARLPEDGSADELVEQAVVGTVVFETALVALRRLAQEHHSARRQGAAPPDGGPHPS
jgi:DNA-binding transcriptional MerR regulator